jgi:drug/metabolite transporter (DMT)-like permease
VRIGIALALLYAIWSSTYLALRIVVAAMPALLSAGVRYVAAGLVLLVFLRVRGAPWPTARQWLGSAPLGALFFLGGNGFVAIAERTVSSGVAAVVCASTPLWAAVMGRFFGRRVSRGEAIGLGVGFVGVGVLCWGDGMAGDRLSLGLLLCAPVAWALGSTLGPRLPLPAGIMSAATEMLTGGALMLVVGFAFGERVPAHVDAGPLLALAYLAVFGSLVGFSAYNFLLRTTRASVAMSYAYVNPALAVLLGAVAAGEPLGATTAVATALIIAAVVLIARSKGRA